MGRPHQAEPKVRDPLRLERRAVDPVQVRNRQ